MEAIAYQDMIRQQKQHWWFRARRNILRQILRTLASNSEWKILEVNCNRISDKYKVLNW